MSTAPTGRALAFARRYAPFLALLGVLGLLLVAAPSRPVGNADSLLAGPDAGVFDPASPQAGGPAGSGTTPTAGASGAPAVGGTPGSTAGGSGGAPGAPGSVGGSGGGVPSAGAALPCVPRPLNSALPCKPGWAGGSNGGSTAKNVTGSKIVVVWYVTYINEATRSISAGTGEEITEEDHRQDSESLEKFLNKNWQTYGRTVDVIPYFGSHDVTDDAGLKAEAVEIDNQLKAFAVAAGQMPVPLADELSRRGIINFNTYQRLSSYYAQRAPYAWSVFGDADLLNAFTAEYVDKRLKGRVAQFAGDGSNTKTRVFGVAFEGVFKPSADDLIARLKRVGVEPVVASYGSDIANAQQQALNIISQFRSAGVTTIINIGNVVAPVFITSNADTQRYYPEYLINGYTGQDTEEAARLYSQTQWNHAFGFTQLSVRNPFEEAQGYQAAKAGNPGRTPTKVVIAEYLALQQIMNGIEMAGPQLTPARFAAGLRTVPASTATPKLPKISYGGSGPGPFTGRDDIAEVWWSSDRDADFDGKRGTYVRLDGGRRVDLGTFPRTVPAVFR
jgi:hypothetical protein